MPKDLEVRHCRVLVALSEHGGVAAAARRLGLAQSTVSETLLSLERVIGAPVTVRRHGREATLTPAALTLVPHAQALIAASEAALAVVSAQSQGVIRLGTVESISSFLLPRPLRAFREVWPGIDVRVTIGLCEDLRSRVDRFELDAALTIETVDLARDHDGQHLKAKAPAALRLVTSPGHRLARGPIDRAALVGHTLLLADPDGAFNDLMRAWCHAGVQGVRFESAGSVDGVKRGVQSSEAIGVLPDYAVVEELAAGSLAELRVREALPAIALRLTAVDPPFAASPLQNLIAQIGAAIAAV
jgi:molybdate transport repressor ModE-like protein